MAIILPAKKFQSLLEKKRESFLVFTHNKAGDIRGVWMTEYLEKEKK